jgi:hypothetical protein
MLHIVCWKWGTRFAASHVNVLWSMLARQLQLPFVLHCITDDATGIRPEVWSHPMPRLYAKEPRCRRRMIQFGRGFIRRMVDPDCQALTPGPDMDDEPRIRVLAIDLDVVIVDDITALLSRDEPIVGWRVGHAGVLSGSFLLFDAGALEDAWRHYDEDPIGYPVEVQPRGVPSDQAMVNHWLQRYQVPTGVWTEADGFVSYYGRGYERLEHLGVGPSRPQLPPGARIVVLGSEDLYALEQPEIYPWVKEHYR